MVPRLTALESAYHLNLDQLRLKPEYYNNNVTIRPFSLPYTKLSACPSKLSGIGGISRLEIKQDLGILGELIEQKELEIKALVDGGNTEETTENIIYSLPPEALDLIDELLAKSPYLSDTVITEAATKEEVLSNPLLHDILIANPQSATNEEVLDRLDQRVDPMPEDMYKEILQGVNILAPLTAEKAAISALKTDNTTFYYQLMNRYLADTSQYPANSLPYLLYVRNTSEAAYLKAFLQLNEGDVTVMNTTLSGIPTRFNLSTEDQTFHGYYLQFMAFMHQMQTDTLPGLLTDSLMEIQLQELMEDAPEPIKSYKRKILIANHVIEYYEPYLYDEGVKSASTKKDHRMGLAGNQVSIQVFPNPANELIVVRYNLAKEFANTQEKAVLEMVTTNGHALKILNLYNSSGHIVLPTKSFVPGMYLILIKAVNNKVESQKLVIIH